MIGRDDRHEPGVRCLASGYIRADNGGVTPSMIAAVEGDTACLRALAEGAARQGVALDVNAVGTVGRWRGKTALDLALERVHDNRRPALIHGWVVDEGDHDEVLRSLRFLGAKLGASEDEA